MQKQVKVNFTWIMSKILLFPAKWRKFILHTEENERQLAKNFFIIYKYCISMMMKPGHIKTIISYGHLLKIGYIHAFSWKSQ